MNRLRQVDPLHATRLVAVAQAIFLGAIQAIFGGAVYPAAAIICAVDFIAALVCFWVAWRAFAQWRREQAEVKRSWVLPGVPSRDDAAACPMTPSLQVQP